VTSQERLNIPDMPMGGFVGGGGGAAPAAAPVEEEEAAPAAAEKTMFNLKLEKFDAGAKPKVIKEIKAMRTPANEGGRGKGRGGEDCRDTQGTGCDS
jgi:hypothetical protein